MKTLDDLYQQMVNEMPFPISPSVKPYIKELASIYALSVANHTLREVAFNLNDCHSSLSAWENQKEEILNTKIQLP